MLSACRSPTSVLPRSAGRDTTGLLFAREVAIPAMSVAAIVGSADIRIPIGLPGHRALIWLSLLVAVALVTRRRDTVIAVGAACTAATVMLHAGPSPSVRYLAAAAMLYAVAGAPAVQRRPWLVVIAAAPIHLVAMADPVAAVIRGGHLAGILSVGMGEKLQWHLVFGLAAGLLGWGLARGMGRLPRFGEVGKE